MTGTKETDDRLSAWLMAIEATIRNHTNNRFTVKEGRQTGVVKDGFVYPETMDGVRENTTWLVQPDCPYPDLLRTVKEVFADHFLTDLPVVNGGCVLYPVVYPPDVKMGVVNIFKWEEKNRPKIGVQAESISRHNVTYGDTISGAGSEKGYPKSLMDFLKPYRKARFGGGVHV